jgi:hypothetical protein
MGEFTDFISRPKRTERAKCYSKALSRKILSVLEQAVITGKMYAEVFSADNKILMKCPSKYNYCP